MRVATATFNGVGSPVVEFVLKGANGVSHKLEGIVDTGYSGFILLPLLRFVKLGIALVGTSDFGLADGQRQNKAFGMAMVELGDRRANGEVVLDMTGPHTLLGMQFMRQLGLGLVVGNTDCALYDEEQLGKQLAKSDSAT